MLIIKTDYLTDDMFDSLTDLVLDVNEADEAKYASPDDADFYAFLYDDGSEDVTVPEEIDADELDPDSMAAVIAVYEMGETHNDETVVELSAFTSPRYRQRGCFKTLLRSMEEELSGFAVRFAVYENDTNKAVLKRINAVHDHDEVMMAISIKDYRSDAPESVQEIETDIQNVHTDEGDYEEGSVRTRNGECFFKLYGASAYIYGILTYDSARRQGYAENMLKRLFKDLSERGVTEASLEVSYSNTSAVRLYEKLGFSTVDRLSYYYVLK